MNESLECTKNSFKAIEYCLERQILLNVKLMTFKADTNRKCPTYILKKIYDSYITLNKLTARDKVINCFARNLKRLPITARLPVQSG